jgi:hypothetical protein
MIDSQADVAHSCREVKQAIALEKILSDSAVVPLIVTAIFACVMASMGSWS